MDPRDLLGQLFMIGIAGPTLSPEEREFMERAQPAGVIYFKRNVESPLQLRSLSQKFVALLKNPLIAIDQEGGRVARLGSPFTEFPGNIYLGRIFEKTGNVHYAEGQARVMARELKSIGVNYNFTPVADIDTNPKNPIIGGMGRSFGKDPKVVAQLVRATLKMYQKEKVVSCVKHFPGHGDTFSDSHKVLPTVAVSKKTIFGRELIPFKAAIAAGVPTLMTAHVIYKALDPKLPATLSKKVLSDLLRKNLKFKGVIVSDDLEMNAIARHGEIAEAAIDSLQAGADLLLICKSLERAEEVFQTLQKEFLRSAAFRKRCLDALKRVSKLKKSYLGWMGRTWPLLPKKGGWLEHQELAQRISQLGKP